MKQSYGHYFYKLKRIFSEIGQILIKDTWTKTQNNSGSLFVKFYYSGLE